MVNYRKRFKKELHEFICKFREIYRLNYEIYSGIDIAFEQIIMDQINLIPDAWIKGVYETWSMLVGMSECIDFHKLDNVIQKNCSKIWFSVNSYNFVLGYIESQGFSKNVMAILRNLMSEFKPLFKCIDYMFAHPEEVVHRMAMVSDMDNKEFGDII